MPNNLNLKRLTDELQPEAEHIPFNHVNNEIDCKCARCRELLEAYVQAQRKHGIGSAEADEAWCAWHRFKNFEPLDWGIND